MEESTLPPVTTRSVGMRYGVIMALVSIVYFIALTVAAVDMTTGIGRWSSVIFYIVIIYLAHKNFIDNGSGFMSYGQGMGIVFWIGLIGSVIYTVFFYIYIKFIDTGFVEAIKVKQIEQMQGQGMSDAQIDQAMGYASMFMSPEALFIFGFFGGMIVIVIVGLIVTLFTQKSNPEPSF